MKHDSNTPMRWMLAVMAMAAGSAMTWTQAAADPVEAVGAAVATSAATAAIEMRPSAVSGRAPAQTTDRLIIKYRKNTGETARLGAVAAAQAALNRTGLQMRPGRRGTSDAEVMHLDRRVPLATLAEIGRTLQAANPEIEYVEPDRLLRAQALPNDPYASLQWDLTAGEGVGAPDAWPRATGTGVVVAVLDTGYRPHADLVANLVDGYDMIADPVVANDGDGRDADPSDPGDWVAANECGDGDPAAASSWHGTHVAGTIAAVAGNGVGIAGVSPGARVMPVRVLGKCGGYTSDIAEAFEWASGGAVDGVPPTSHPARVINLSLGGPGACDRTTQTAINDARARGTVVVVAAGNSGADAQGFTPANCTGVITVAAVDRRGLKTWYSNTGMPVDLAAPGGDSSVAATNGILSTWNTGTTTPGADAYAYLMGTSMSAPHVSAVAALMLSVNPALTPDRVMTLLRASARPFPQGCTGCGAGMLDAAGAVAAAMADAADTRAVDEVFFDETEPNDSAQTANAVGTDVTAIRGRLTTQTDPQDVFAVVVPAGASLTATLIPDQDLDLYVNAADTGELLGASTHASTAADIVAWSNAGTASRTVLLRVVLGGRTGGGYTLRLAR